MKRGSQNGMKRVSVNVDQKKALVTINSVEECKKMIDKGMCDKIFIWNPSNCQCERDKSCDVGNYMLDYENYKCRKKIGR